MMNYTTTEAATIIGIGVKEINNTIDKESFLKASGKQSGTRYLDIRHLLYLQIKRELKEIELAMNLKKRIFEEISLHQCSRSIHPASILTIDLEKVRKKVANSVAKFGKMRRMIEENSNILGGEPVIKGTRVPVYLIGKMVAEGTEISAIIKSYPSLSEEKIKYAVQYSEAYPRKGRTPNFFWQKEKPVNTVRIPLG